MNNVREARIRRVAKMMQEITAEIEAIKVEERDSYRRMLLLHNMNNIENSENAIKYLDYAIDETKEAFVSLVLATGKDVV